MRICKRALLFLLLLGSIFLQPLSASAQTSIGYADPHATSELLAYRLPDWSYQIWNANFGLNGGGMDQNLNELDRFANNFSTRLGSAWRRNWESDERDAGVGVSLAGDYGRAHTGLAFRENKSRRLNGNFQLDGDRRQYLRGGPFSVAVSGKTGWNYREEVRDIRFDQEWTEESDYRRSSTHEFAVGAGWGRLRNVVPVLRAHRLSERLTALGRPPLTGAQIQEMAQVFAKEYGYRAVFDRADRHFWEDVLAPLLPQDNPLTPYEIFYLTDVLSEDLGGRYQGFRLGAAYRYGEHNSDNGPLENRSREREPTLEAWWSHNLSLTQQVSVRCNWGYRWQNQGDRLNEDTVLDCTVSHLWNLADRYLLETSGSYHHLGNIDSDTRDRAARLQSVLSIYLEDRVSLNTRVAAAYDWGRNAEDRRESWNWSYSLGLSYHLDRLLL
jgi:hypothetical protein